MGNNSSTEYSGSNGESSRKSDSARTSSPDMVRQGSKELDAKDRRKMEKELEKVLRDKNKIEIDRKYDGTPPEKQKKWVEEKSKKIRERKFLEQREKELRSKLGVDGGITTE